MDGASGIRRRLYEFHLALEILRLRPGNAGRTGAMPLWWADRSKLSLILDHVISVGGIMVQSFSSMAAISFQFPSRSETAHR